MYIKRIIRMFARLFGIESSHEIVWKNHYQLHHGRAQVNEEHITSDLVSWLNSALRNRSIKLEVIEEKKPKEGGRWNKKKKCYSILPTGRDIYISFKTKSGKSALLSIQAKKVDYNINKYVCSMKDEEQARDLERYTNVIARIIDSYDFSFTTHVFYSCLEDENYTYKSAIVGFPSSLVQNRREVDVLDLHSGVFNIPKFYNKQIFLNNTGSVGANNYLDIFYNYLIENHKVMYKKNSTGNKRSFDESVAMAFEELSFFYKNDDNSAFTFIHLEEY